jgi:6-pyruvoyltetrahydropterin/6-carboxytetrahydropterin synthase
MMYELEITKHFSGAHKLAGYPGDCRKLHGHNWNVTVILQANALDEIGIALDFKVLKKELNDVIDRFDHAYLNELEEFADCNPTSENLPRIIYGKLSSRLNDGRIKVARISVEETPGSRASYFE